MSVDIALVTRAADFAARRHVNQRRKGAAQEPYFNHLAEVAALLAEHRKPPDAELIAAGYLHDTLEDTETAFEDLETAFGLAIAQLVSEVTDDKSLPKAERKRRQIEAAPKKSERARLLKIADKTSNVRAMVHSPPSNWERARIVEYIEWAEAVVAGCRGLNAGLEREFDAAVTLARDSLNLAA